jgi:hypothetical protein
MKIKDGASLAGLQLEMRRVLITAESIWTQNDQELVVTGGTDGAHSAGSLHYYGYAVDLRSRYFSEGIKSRVVDALRLKLGEDYDVVVHSTHIHVEYNALLMK